MMIPGFISDSQFGGGREFSRTVVKLFKYNFEKREAQEQGGLLSGKDPTAFDEPDPIRLWIIQVGVIITTASLLSLILRKIRQPKVIAEVLGGILLGPTAFGRIPGFTQHIFPLASRPYLSLVANIGLCLFLFLVGLEIDMGIIRRNARLSFTVALFGMVIPFGFGAALATPLYDEFIKEGGKHAVDAGIVGVKFTHFMLFTGVAYSITAFPVLCRILTELKLLDTTVGIVVLSAGVGNDIVGWVLLALSVALVNAGSGLMAVWILLTCVGWTLFMLTLVRMALMWLARKTGSLESGPTVFFMTVTMLIMFTSAFFTDVIGVHAIFGAFIAGLVIPREGNLTIALTEKLEDMVAIIFLPLYFTLSGLSTDLGLLNDGITWAYTIAIISLAFLGKFGGCTIAARYLAGFSPRESSAIGALMSCKGLVELIVLNVGLSAGILSQVRPQPTYHSLGQVY
ncbi:Sodium/hydrogen exchanger [Pluteus cervinus]|uniref:Sodium/hydrogen exchanger n=1 Tax=Pluteus cervinus TaxID=181527 RepID=A0ACD3AQN1_9AGAR|nr:Sodium/hydrogen exchanger [Pluteus cervinus]